MSENDGFIIDKPNGIELYRLNVVRSALSLEMRTGMKMSRGVNVRKLWAEPLGLKPRDSFEKFIAALDKKIAGVVEKGDLGIHSTG